MDIARFGFEALRASPRQADLIILSGRVSIKMAPVIRRIWDQMLEPKWAISMGACCSSMGVFNNYAMVPSDKFLPIDVHVPGCPPRPEALMHGILRLRDKIQGNPTEGWRESYGAVGTEELLPGETPLESPGINVFNPGTPPVPDATGLELTAQELRDAHSESILDTSFRGDRATWSPNRSGSATVLDHLQEKGYTMLASLHGVDYYPRSRASGSSTRCSTEATWTGSASRRASNRGSAYPVGGRAFPDADFQERELYDMFGVVFDGHPDLRRILMPEDYEGYPQRRDFPVGGEPVLFTYNEEQSYGKWQ